MKLYAFNNLSKLLDNLNYPAVSESRFEVTRKDFSEEESRGNITFKNDGIYLMINGIEHKGYMYYKDYDVEQFGLPKFHIIECKTIIQQRNIFRFHGYYFWSNSNIVDIKQRGTNKIHKDVVLNLCRNCSEAANIENYSTTKGFFELLDIQDNEPMKKEDLDINGYVKNWQQISKKTRILNNFTCNNCSLKIEKKIDYRFIHVHHRNGNKLNNKRENLECLCILCHSNVDSIHTTNFQRNWSSSEISSFVKMYKEDLISLNNPYIHNYLRENNL